MPFLSLAVYLVLFGLFLFGGAGTMDWARGWTLMAVLVACRLTSVIILYRANRELMRERSTSPTRRGQPISDVIILRLYMAAYAGLVAVAGWDGYHGGMLGAIPEPIRVLGLVSFVAGWVLIHVVLRTNTYAVVVVRHQPERGQRVIRDGPYRFVRHPMYAGIGIVMVGVCLWLGSALALALVVVPMALLMWRIHIEERTVGAALPDYADYQATVRWRLVPGIW